MGDIKQVTRSGLVAYMIKVDKKRGGITLHAKSLATLKTFEFYSHSHRCHRTRQFNLGNFSLSYRLMDAAVLIQLLLLGESVQNTTLQILQSFKT